MDTRGVEVAGNKICWEKRYQTRGRSGAGPLHRSIRRRERGACSLFRRELRHPLRGRLYLGRNGSLFTSVNTPRSRHSRKTFRRGVSLQPAPLSHTWHRFGRSLAPHLVRHTPAVPGPAGGACPAGPLLPLLLQTNPGPQSSCSVHPNTLGHICASYTGPCAWEACLASGSVHRFISRP